MIMSFDGGPRDWVCLISAILLIAMGVIAFFEIDIPFVAWIVAVVVIIGSLFGMFDTWNIFGDNKFFGTLYYILFILLILFGVNVFYAIPFISTALALSPVAITHYIVNAVIALFLIIVAFQSD